MLRHLAMITIRTGKESKQGMDNTKNKNTKYFTLLYIGQTISQMGSSMTNFATIIWAYSVCGQVLASSLLAVCSTVPYLIVSLAGGAVADNVSKKKIMLFCDTAAAFCSLIVMLCFFTDSLQLWILCIVNVVSGFMNAFQNPASQVAVSLLIDKKDYARISGVQSIVGSIIGILTPIAAAALLSFGGLGLVLSIDLATFLFAFVTLLLFVQIPNITAGEKKLSLHDLKASMLDGIRYLWREKGLRSLFLMYSVLELMGAVSFDSMYSPLLLARTGNDEMIVGIVSSFMAVGCMAASILITVMKTPKKKVPIMYFGSILCLTGIMLFGMGRNIYWWCFVVFCGCFGAPIYQTYQTVILREKVPVSMQGRIFSLQGMITQSLAPLGYLLGAVLADYVFEPFMQQTGRLQEMCMPLVGSGKGAGMGLMFVIAGAAGIVILLFLRNNRYMKELDQ